MKILLVLLISIFSFNTYAQILYTEHRDIIGQTDYSNYVYVKDGADLSTVLTVPNTIYEIKYKHTLSTPFQIGANSTLVFDGGVIEGGTIDLNYVNIEAPSTSHVFKNCTFTGRVANSEVYADWFGTNISESDNSQFINNAISAVKVGWVVLNKGTFKTIKEIKIPNGCNLKGQGKGFASNIKTEIRFEGNNRTAIEMMSFYGEIRDLMIKNAGTGLNTGVKYAEIVGQTYGVTRTELTNVTIQEFYIGIDGYNDDTTYSHYHDNVFVWGCDIGVNMTNVNNVVFNNSTVRSCGVFFKIDTCTHFLFEGGVAEIFTGATGAETNSSVIFQLNKINSVSIVNSYFENGTSQPLGTNTQVATLTEIEGFVFDNNYISNSLTAGQPPIIEPLADNCRGISIKNNRIGRMATGRYLFAAQDPLAKVSEYYATVKNNQMRVGGFEKPIKWVPTLTTSLVDDPSVVYQVQEAHYFVEGSIVHLAGKIQISQKGSSVGYLSIGNLPLPMRSGLGAEMEIIGNLKMKGFTGDDEFCQIESGQQYLRLFKEDYSSLFTNNLAGSTVIVAKFSISYPINQIAQ